MMNLIVHDPTEKFLNFLNTHGYSHELKNENGTMVAEVDNYRAGKYKGIIGLDAIMRTEKGKDILWVRI